MVLSNFNGVGVGFGTPLNFLGLGTGDGCGIGLGLGWGFGTAFGSQYQSSRLEFQGVEFGQKEHDNSGEIKRSGFGTREIGASQ